jgi:anaerobic carbon-monoxide dehydrogenase iron sulfur subunit
MERLSTSAPAQAPTQGRAHAQGRVIFTPEWCRTCRVCEVVCAISKEGQARPAIARIAITFDEFWAGPGAEASAVPISARLCAQCADAPCLEACRVEAMTRDERTGAIRVHEASCIGCMRCNKACPWGVPQLHPDRRKALICDLCSDRPTGPACVAQCPLSGQALRYDPTYYARGGVDEHI